MAYFFMEQFEEAVALCEKAIKRNPEHTSPLWYITASYGHLGREQEAKAAFARLREKRPRYSYLHIYKFLFKFKDPADWNYLADGLRKAGMQ